MGLGKYFQTMTRAASSDGGEFVGPISANEINKKADNNAANIVIMDGEHDSYDAYNATIVANTSGIAGNSGSIVTQSGWIATSDAAILSIQTDGIANMFSKGNSVTVGPSGADYTTIQAGVNAVALPASGTTSGNYTVFIYPGLYDEAVTIGHGRINLIGLGPDAESVTIKPTTSTKTIVLQITPAYTTDQYTVANMHLDNTANSAVTLSAFQTSTYGFGDCTMRNVKITHECSGTLGYAFITARTGVTLRDCDFTSTLHGNTDPTYGAHLFWDAGSLMFSRDIRDCRFKLTAGDASGITFMNNTASTLKDVNIIGNTFELNIPGTYGVASTSGSTTIIDEVNPNINNIVKRVFDNHVMITNTETTPSNDITFFKTRHHTSCTERRVFSKNNMVMLEGAYNPASGVMFNINNDVLVSRFDSTNMGVISEISATGSGTIDHIGVYGSGLMNTSGNLVVTSPNGTVYSLTVDNNGNISGVATF